MPQAPKAARRSGHGASAQVSSTRRGLHLLCTFRLRGEALGRRKRQEVTPFMLWHPAFIALMLFLIIALMSAQLEVLDTLLRGGGSL
jgi:hypothetical protein